MAVGLFSWLVAIEGGRGGGDGEGSEFLGDDGDVWRWVMVGAVGWLAEEVRRVGRRVDMGMGRWFMRITFWTSPENSAERCLPKPKILPLLNAPDQTSDPRKGGDCQYPWVVVVAMKVAGGGDGSEGVDDDDDEMMMMMMMMMALLVMRAWWCVA
ncbi:hypothetical protein Tco_0531456 [Tanacetum coccineum]